MDEIDRRQVLAGGGGLALLTVAGVARAAVADVPTWLMFVLSNPVAGMEAAYESWSSETHVRQVASIPGMVSGRFYRRRGAATDGVPSYLAAYRLEVPSMATVFAEIRRRLGSGELTVSPAFDAHSVRNLVYRQTAAVGRDVADADRLLLLASDADMAPPRVAHARLRTGIIGPDQWGAVPPPAHLLLAEANHAFGDKVLAAIPTDAADRPGGIHAAYEAISAAF